MDKNELKEELNADLKELHNKVDAIIQEFKDKWDKKLIDSDKENKDYANYLYIENENWENLLDYEKKLEKIVNDFYDESSNKKKELKIRIVKASSKANMLSNPIPALVLKFVPIDGNISVKVFYNGKKIDEYSTSSADSYGSYRWISYIGKYLFEAYRIYKINTIEDLIRKSSDIYTRITCGYIVELDHSFKECYIKSIIKTNDDNENSITIRNIFHCNKKTIINDIDDGDLIRVYDIAIDRIERREQLIEKDK